MSLPFELVFLMEEQQINGEIYIHVITFWSNGMVKGDRRVRTGEGAERFFTENKGAMEGKK
jgi:hypothetical protein